MSKYGAALRDVLEDQEFRRDAWEITKLVLKGGAAAFAIWAAIVIVWAVLG